MNTKHATAKTCKWCDSGVALEGKEHWVVTSIRPAKIKIVRCQKLKSALTPPGAKP